MALGNPTDDDPIGLGLCLEHDCSSLTKRRSLEKRETSHEILDIVLEYALRKFDDSEERLAAGRNKFLSTIDQYVTSGRQVKMCLPAFPFKSANRVEKVLGTLPDKAEELALERLNIMCERIQAVYKPGAQVTVISDGITYNDLLSISDVDVWAYGKALRVMAREKKFFNLTFSRLNDLLELRLPGELREITYVANCTNFRRLLLNRYGDTDISIDERIANDPDTKLTYLGYRRFLESDLRHIFLCGTDLTKNGYKRDVKFLAKEMLLRGHAFAKAIKHAYPDHLRLSIHESIGEHKISISLLNTRTGYTTPWHCSVALLGNGEWVSAPTGNFLKDPQLELVYDNNRPSYFREKAHTLSMRNINETTASYLQERKLFSGTLSGYSSPSMASTSGGSSSYVESSLNSSYEQSSEPSVVEETSMDDTTSNAPSTAYGRRLIPQIMDSLAITDPNRIVFSLATASGNSLSFKEISAREFAKAVDKVSWWLHGQVGRSASAQPIGYIGPHDLRHVLLTYACVKTGNAALFLSPKNNTEGALTVLEATKCEIWVKATEVATVPLVTEMVRNRALKVLELPLLDELLDTSSVEPFEYTKTFEEAANEPFCFLHTSGSTGVPKPIPWSHGLIGTMDAIRLLPPTEGDGNLEPWTAEWKTGDRIYSAFPMCHGAGIIMDILMPALFGLTCVLGPSNVLPNLSLIESVADLQAVDIWSLVPSLVDELGETYEVLEKFKSSKFICASGGPVSPVSAGKVNDVIRVLNLTGTTEGLFIGNLVVPREDWFWFAFHPYSGFEFRELEPNTYEHWVHRNEHMPLFQGIFHTLPQESSVNFKDLYTRHPTKPNLWAFKGRSDDMIVLSSGYKIIPLETEAAISTHPSIKGCLIFGSGKTQAGLLIELWNPLEKSEELSESIWTAVEEAKSSSRLTYQFQRDFITFAEEGRPFVRTDKGTVKRRATLELYAEFIERFYESRNYDTKFDIDTTSTELLVESIRIVLASSTPTMRQALPDEDLFALGLDSLGAFAVVNTIRASSKFLLQLAPRHLYANPTLSKFSSAIARLAVEAERTEQSNDQASDQIRHMLAQHKARQSFRLNAFDYVNPNHYMGLVFYFPLRDDVSNETVFENLQEGLNRTIELIPALGGKMMDCSEQEIGTFTGELCVAVPPTSQPTRDRLVYKDLSKHLPSFENLQKAGFVPSLFRDEDVLPQDPFPQFPADILVAQANFIQGGCLLAVDLNHCCLDGIGAMVALKVWGENCRYLQGDQSATCSWYDPESFNHSLPDVLHELEGRSNSRGDVDPDTWGFLPFVPAEEDAIDTSSGIELAKCKRLGQPPPYTLHSVWPLPAEEIKLETTLFLISPEKLQQLKDDVLSNLETNSAVTSISDIVEALFWQSAIRARFRVASELRGASFKPDELSILELPTDGRPFFSPHLPATYMGSMLILNRASISVQELCAPETSVGRIAMLLREASARITPAVVHDAFTLLKSLPDYTRFSTANMGLHHMHTMISNMMLFDTKEICFGEEIFANGGSPVTMRPQLERGAGRFRFQCIFPMKEDGGVELVLGTFPEEREMLTRDEGFMKYADLVDVALC